MPCSVQLVCKRLACRYSGPAVSAMQHPILIGVGLMLLFSRDISSRFSAVHCPAEIVHRLARRSSCTCPAEWVDNGGRSRSNKCTHIMVSSRPDWLYLHWCDGLQAYTVWGWGLCGVDVAFSTSLAQSIRLPVLRVIT